MKKGFNLSSKSLSISISAFAERIYISAKDVMVAENGIFFEPKVAWMCSNGHYVSGTTTCPKCGDKQRK